METEKLFRGTFLNFERLIYEKKNKSAERDADYRGIKEAIAKKINKLLELAEEKSEFTLLLLFCNCCLYNLSHSS